MVFGSKFAKTGSELAKTGSELAKIRSSNMIKKANSPTLCVRSATENRKQFRPHPHRVLNIEVVTKMSGDVTSIRHRSRVL